MGALTTHVLDTARGIPAAGMRIVLFRLGAQDQLICDRQTNADGRCDAPLLSGADFVTGSYRLIFYAGDYFRAIRDLQQPAFLEQIPVQFNLDKNGGHYHVPLLVSPFSYSTYRGS